MLSISGNRPGGQTMSYNRHTSPRDRSLRAADADREGVTELLRREHLAGRLDDTELDARLAACFAAVTYADLDALIADLPADEPPPRARLRGAPFWPLAPAAADAGGRRPQPWARAVADRAACRRNDGCPPRLPRPHLRRAYTHGSLGAGAPQAGQRAERGLPRVLVGDRRGHHHLVCLRGIDQSLQPLPHGVR